MHWCSLLQILPTDVASVNDPLENELQQKNCQSHHASEITLQEELYILGWK